MTRYMVDAIGGDSGRLPADTPTIAGYITGSDGIIWTTADWARFPGVKIPIDQSDGEQVFPQHKILIADVESGAKTIQNAVNQTRLRAAEKLDTTIYVSASNYSLAQRMIAAAGLTGHAWWWVANWGLTIAEASALVRGRVIGVQCASADDKATAGMRIPGTKLTLAQVNCDLSVISDTWAPAPAKPAAKKTVASKVKATAKKAAPHRKTAGASAGALLGVGITAILKGAHVHITAEEAGAISTIAAAITGTVTPTKPS